MKNVIYADNAATTKLDNDAFEAMKPYLLNNYGNASQPYSFSRSVKKAIKEARETIARCISAEPEEIFFTSGGTESNNWVIKDNIFSNINHKTIITSEFEHHTIIRACESIENIGYPVVYLPITKSGIVDIEMYKKIITNNTYLTSIMFANNEIGTIQPIKELCKIAHENGSLFHTDAVQAVGHIDIDVKNLDIDMLSASAHKFNGPKGIGFLYIKKGTSIHSLMSGGMQEFGYRAGTENVASIVGMAIALKKNVDLLENSILHINRCVDAFFDEFNKYNIDYVINGKGDKIPGNINLSFKNKTGEGIMHLMDLKGVLISTGSACDSVNTRVSHVIKAINVPDEYQEGTIRISLNKDNTEEEARAIAKKLKDAISL